MVSERLAQSAKYLKTGFNWENTLFFLSLFCCVFVKSVSCFNPLIAFLNIASSAKLVESPCCIFSLIHVKITPFYQLYLYFVNNIRHNKFGEYLSPILIFLSVTY